MHIGKMINQMEDGPKKRILLSEFKSGPVKRLRHDVIL